jgi:hypothetical protein
VIYRRLALPPGSQRSKLHEHRVVSHSVLLSADTPGNEVQPFPDVMAHLSAQAEESVNRGCQEVVIHASDVLVIRGQADAPCEPHLREAAVKVQDDEVVRTEIASEAVPGCVHL